ncbi:MAG: hypothetical protein HFG55_06175 [Lachnospiraceae bacterium]|nr:hypothetical protein [Lachnospiraceae bacterium]
MSSKIYLWIEDRKGKAGYLFWDSLLKHLFPNLVVESKKNSSGLLKAVRDLENAKNRYVIVFDNSFDNIQAVMERKLLKQYADNRENVVLMDIICFEYILLEFKSLIDWIYAPDDEFLKKRAKVILAREELIGAIENGNMNYKDIKEIVDYDEHIDEHNVEQLSAKLLFDLTRNTGFEVSKGRIGDCWIRSCCEWKNRMDNDICGLDHKGKLSVWSKMKHIYEGTCLKKQFQGAGLEAAL